jgi:hypothetical protein
LNLGAFVAVPVSVPATSIIDSRHAAVVDSLHVALPLLAVMVYESATCRMRSKSALVD